MRYQTIHKKPETPIEAIISIFENAIGKHNATKVQDTKNDSVIENVYEIPEKGAIFARFAQDFALRFNINTEGQPSGPADGFIMYLGFDQSTQEYKSMISDVLQALNGK